MPELRYAVVFLEGKVTENKLKVIRAFKRQIPGVAIVGLRDSQNGNFLEVKCFNNDIIMRQVKPFFDYSPLLKKLPYGNSEEAKMLVL